MTITTGTIGFPRIGPHREMKKALELYWKKGSSLEELLKVAEETEKAAWQLQQKEGIELIGLDGTLYDQMLDWAFYLGVAPPRFASLSGYDQYFAMARGADGGIEALDMSKFFDTNYHYLVSELTPESAPKPDFKPFLEKVKRGQDVLGKASAVPIIIGPNTFVGLSKPADTAKPFDRSTLVKAFLPAYVEVLKELKALGVPEVQIHEPILTISTATDLKADFELTFKELSAVGVPLHLVTYYDDIGETYPWATKLPVQAISLDFLGVPGSAYGNETAALVEKHGFPEGVRLGAGVIDGRSVWSDEGAAAPLVAALLALGIKDISVQSSSSLQHLPYDKDLEKDLPADIANRLSFAKQKLGDIVKAAQQAPSLKATSLKDALPVVSDPVEEVEESLFNRSEHFEVRRPKQIQTKPFPTTTIGSFPQTPELRRARLQFKKGQLSAEDYEKVINEYMQYAVDEQEKMDIDVLVHGEPERTDMVEYFGVKMEGFHFTEAGWVQSYGSRYVRPPIIKGDVTRPAAMTVKEFKQCQSLTKRPVKGMLTGPVTILNWSFPRKDITRRAQAFQLALALRDEVADLEAAGCRVIQVDEPALREGLPLKRNRWDSYLHWAVRAFRLSTVVAKPSTQIVTHLCYSEFADILKAIDELDADTLTIENSRSGDEMLICLAKYGYSRDVGAGVYDVHSPVVPSVEFMKNKIQSFLDVGLLKGDIQRLWVNPDCGLKTREWKQVIPSLTNMAKASEEMAAKVKTAKA